jgi:hypothetical protein
VRVSFAGSPLPGRRGRPTVESGRFKSCRGSERLFDVPRADGKGGASDLMKKHLERAGLMEEVGRVGAASS